MVEVIPFNGFIYNKDKIKDIENVMSPPYDIISEEMQEKLYKKHPFNFVRLILGKQYFDDTDDNNRYTRAKKFFESWIKDSILIQYNKPAIFAYKIKYKIKKQIKTMNGFFTENYLA